MIIGQNRVLLSGLLQEAELKNALVRQGQFYNVVVGMDRVVCLPRTKAAASRLPRRAAILCALAELDLGFRVPIPLQQSPLDSDGSLSYLVLSRIPGAPLDAERLDNPRMVEGVAAQYVELLKSMANAAVGQGVRLTVPMSNGRWSLFAADVRAELFDLMSASGRLRAQHELGAVESLPHLSAGLVHGDLGPENVLWESVNGLPILSGVVDWDEVEFGDPAEDLAAIGAGYGKPLLSCILAMGGWTGRDTTARIAAITGTFALQQALAACRDGDEEELADGLCVYR